MRPSEARRTSSTGRSAPWSAWEPRAEECTSTTARASPAIELKLFPRNTTPAHRTTRPYRPSTNGKAGRFIQTLLREWAYATTYTHADQRNAALLPWLRWYHEQRPHASLQGRAPITRLPNVLGNDI
ncbi:MAG: transposase [Chthonomonadales bacterium]|nr:transposase [Chthonomonadales bacterium]